MAFNFYEYMRNRPMVPVVVATMADGTQFTTMVPQSMFVEDEK